jgi:hypothetical protein
MSLSRSVWIESNRAFNAEHALQSTKTADPTLKERIRNCATALDARKMGAGM